MTKFLLSTAATVALLGLAMPAHAAVLIDQSPNVNGLLPGFVAGNTASGQNFLAKFTLTSASILGGIDIYSACRSIGCGTPNIGTNATVKIRKDASGAPAASNLFTILTSVSAIDSVGSTANPSVERVHADFAAATLAAGTYWIGLSGTTQEIGWNLSSAASTAGFYFGNDDNLNNNISGFAGAFRVLGTAAVPEPAAWALMLAGFGLVGGAMRRRQSVRVTYA